jgi:hypothetical protein
MGHPTQRNRRECYDPDLKARPSLLIKKSLIFVHRWLGVALCLLFLTWFASGIVMMYWDFPSVSEQDRLDHALPLDASKIKLSPAEAARKAHLEHPAGTRIFMFNGGPIYQFESSNVSAVTGDEIGDLTPSLNELVAAEWTGLPLSAAKAELIVGVDQWTVQGEFRGLRPLWKYSWPDGQQVYISTVSGQVEQYTTSSSRFWAYLGAIPHWLYFTPLRKNGLAWSRFVIWSSAIATASAVLGIAIGIWMYSPSKRYRYEGAPASIPYRGQKRWHTILGLIFGLAAVTWAFSGFLSMEPFPEKIGTPHTPPALRDFELAGFASKTPAQALAQLGNAKVKELDMLSFAGEPFYLAKLDHGATRIVPVNGPVNGEPMDQFSNDRIMSIVRKQAGDQLAELRVMNDYDVYYLDRHHEHPLPVIYARFNDPENTRYYIDPKTLRIVGGYSSSQWVTRWLYHGLHSFDFPWLYKYRPLWDIVVISFMTGGVALCVTSVILAWRVLRRKLGGLRAGEDLALEN